MFEKKKWFVSCIIPGECQVGAMQFEADEKDVKGIAENMAPCRCAFRANAIEEFEEEMPVGEFVDNEKMIALGYK